MARRQKRPSPSSSSSDEGPVSLAQEAAAQPTLTTYVQAAASQVPRQQIFPPQLDSALQALADRADEISDGEVPEVARVDTLGAGSTVEAHAFDAGIQDVEAPASDAGSKAVEAHASDAELRVATARASGTDAQVAEVDTSGAGSNSSSDCIITGVTSANNAGDSKISNVSVLSSRDFLLMREREEMIEEKRKEIARRYEILQANLALDMREFLSHNPAGAPISASEEFLQAGPVNFRVKADPLLPSQGSEKFPGASNALAEEKKENSVLPSLGGSGVFTSPRGAQGDGRATMATFAMQQPSVPDLADRIVLTDAAMAILWQNAETPPEVFPPLETSSELVRDMMSELKHSASAEFPNCQALSDDKALLALEASRYLINSNGWPSIPGAVTCLRIKKSKHDVAVPAFRPTQAPHIPAQASSKAKHLLVAGGGRHLRIIRNGNCGN
jgi:hypothetical protein